MSFDPIQVRDLLIGDVDEPSGFVREATIRALVERGWPVEAIMAELPGVSADDVRRAVTAGQRAA